MHPAAAHILVAPCCLQHMHTPHASYRHEGNAVQLHHHTEKCTGCLEWTSTLWSLAVSTTVYICISVPAHGTFWRGCCCIPNTTEHDTQHIPHASHTSYTSHTLQDETRRIVEMEYAIAMLRAVFPPNTPHVEGFTSYLEQQKQYKTMNKDQWQSFLRFVQEVCGGGVHAN